MKANVSLAVDVVLFKKCMYFPIFFKMFQKMSVNDDCCSSFIFNTCKNNLEIFLTLLKYCILKPGV